MELKLKNIKYSKEWLLMSKNLKSNSLYLSIVEEILADRIHDMDDIRLHTLCFIDVYSKDISFTPKEKVNHIIEFCDIKELFHKYYSQHDYTFENFKEEDL
jgi:diphthamide biosynthesis methyltransferase